MIVRKQDDGSLILINQTDHARLSGQFAAHWGNEKFMQPRSRESVVRAATFHDCGWHRYETSPLYDPQTKTSPNFFEVPAVGPHLLAFQHGIEWLTEIDAYAGLLISKHRTGLWSGRYGAVQHPTSLAKSDYGPLIKAFILEHEKKQEEQLKNFDKATFLVDYQLLQFWDLFSLSFCRREAADEKFEFVPTSYDGDGRSGVPLTMTVRADGKIAVDPYPFDSRELSLNYVYRVLPTYDFPDQESFRQAYFAAPSQVKVFTFV